MAITLDAVKALISTHPEIAASLIGGLSGGVVGAMHSDEGEKAKGAIGGALLGAGGGALAGTVGKNIQSLMAALTPTPEKALIAGGVAGGGLAGYYGKSHLPSWVKNRLDTQGDLSGQIAANEDREELGLNKGANMLTPEELTKQAELEKTAAKKVAAFDFGMDLYCSENNFDKEALARAHGIEDVAELAPRTIVWLNSQLEQQPQQ